MWSKLVAIVSLVVFSSWALPMLDRPANHALSARPECSTNASAAWVDVVLLIDTSSYMGSENLRKISAVITLVMSKFTIGNRANISAGEHNTRVGVITYDHVARIVANFTAINSLGDLSTVLNKIQVSNTADANLFDALNIIYKCMDPHFNGSCLAPTADLDIDRPTAYVVFASNLDSPSNKYINGFGPANDGLSAVITINFNHSDGYLTGILNSISGNPYNIPGDMYNFLANSNSLANDLSWALTQANCYCQSGLLLLLMDKTKNRYSRYAKCLDYTGWGTPDNYTEFCTSKDQTPLAILSEDEEIFVQNMWWNNQSYPSPYYIGLHQDSKGNWVWYDDNMKEFSSSYSNWAPGYPMNLGKCAISVSSNYKNCMFWKDADCDPQYSGYRFAPCQRGACDAESYYK